MMLNKNLSFLALATLASVFLPIYLSGCGGASLSMNASAVPISNSGSSGNSGGSGNSSGSDSVPSNALAVSQIQKLSNWQGSFDEASGTNNATGQMSMVSSPSLSGAARKFASSFTNYGSERYSVDVGDDTASKNFFYDGWVYVASPASGILNIEMDMNQVLKNGQTVIYGFQCDGKAGTWDYTKNAGTPHNYSDVWVNSNVPCNPQSWVPNTWHHVQIAYSRDGSGNVNYKSFWFDGTKHDLNVTVPSSFALGWSSSLITNFQVDGTGGSGNSTVYLDNFTIYRW